MSKAITIPEELKGAKILCPICGKSLDGNLACESCKRNFAEEVIENAVNESLTDSQIQAQDLLDNAIREMMSNYLPDCELDAETLYPLRSAVIKILAAKGLSEYEVYPWLIQPEEEEAESK